MSTNIIKPSTQVNNISVYDDAKPLNASLQTDSTSLENDIQAVLSVLNAIKDATLTGKWYDDIFEVNSKKRGIKQLNADLNTLEIEVANLIIANENYYLVSASFNTSTGLLTMTLNNGVNVTVNLDGRYIESLNSHSVTELNDVTSAGSGEIITTGERAKLQGIATGAEVNVNADWNATTGDAFIENKPTDVTDLSSHSVTELNDITSAGSGAIIETAERTKLNNISVTQAVDLDQIESDVAVNNAKITNANHTGDVTGSQALTISNEAVTNPKLAHIATGTVKGRTTAGTGDVEDLNIDTTLKTALNLTKNDVGLSNVQNVDTTDASNIADGSVSNTEFQYLANVTSDIQAQIDAIPNEKYLVSASFNTLDGVLTLTLNDTSTITASFDGRYLQNIVEDTTPQLGGNLDLNGNDITGTGNISITGEVEADLHIGPLRGEICFNAKAGEALTKGDPVYISNFDTVGNTPVVGIADADDSNKMPSFGLAKANASLNSSVTVVTFGTLDGIDTSSFNLGDILYISTTGTLTNQPPTGETALIQNIGKVMRSHATNGSVKVGGAGRSNDTPNLNNGNVFIGNASNQVEARALTLDDVSETSTKKIMTDVERNKLQGIQAGAEVNVNADWNATTGDAEILNKPTDVTDLSTHSVTELNDVTNAGSGAIITTAERSKLNNISVTQSVNLDQMQVEVGINSAKVTNATHTGDVTGSQALTISSNAVDNNKLADMAQGTVKARTNVGTGDPQDVDISTTFKSALGLVKADVGLSNVQNVDTTNASNITTGTLNANQLPDTINTDWNLQGDKAIVIGDDDSNTPATTPPAQLYLGGTHNAGYNVGTKLFVDGYDNETSIDVMKLKDENANIDLLLKSGVDYPTLTMRGYNVFNQSNQTLYSSGVNLNNMKESGIYLIGVQATNLPPQRNTSESAYVLVVYQWGTSNGIQILYCTDYDSSTKHNAIYSRTWEFTNFTDWNCVSSTPDTLYDASVNIASQTTAYFYVNETLSTINNRYKQILIMYESTIHGGSVIVAPTLPVNSVYEIGKYSTRYVTFTTPTSTSSTAWRAGPAGVTVTKIRMIGYR